MNSELEEPEVLDAEIPSEEMVKVLVSPADLLSQLEVIKSRAVSLHPTDELSAKRCAALASTCTFASKHAEAQRTAVTDPLNKQVKDHNAIWQPIVKGFEELARMTKMEVSKWVDGERKKAELEQQKLIDAANAERDRLERKAQAERDEVERLRKEADGKSTIVEAELLHLDADRLEKKADKDALRAAQVVTTVAPMQTKTLDLGGATLSTKAPKNTYILPGWDKAKPLKLTDPKLAELLRDPAGLQFLLQHADLNPVYLNKSFGVIPFPAPFATVPDYSGASVRGKS